MTSSRDRLSEIPLFSGCTKKDLQRLERASDEVSVDAGTVLTAQGEQGREAFVILSGAAKVERDGQQVAELGAGDHIGELSLLDGGPRTATVTTTEESTVLVLTRQAFNGVLDEIPTLAHKLLVSLAHRLRAAEAGAHH